MDADTTTPDLVIIDAEIVETTDSFGKETSKTLATSAATSAVLVAGYFAFTYLKPKVVSLIARAKDQAEETVPVITDAPETVQV